MIRLYAIVAAIALVAGLAASWAWSEYRSRMALAADPFGPCRATRVAGDGDLGGPFTLVAGDGTTMGQDAVFDRPALLYFGFASCPDVCPIDNARNSDAADLLQEMGHEVRPVFVTVDPGRDTPEVMADYAANMHPRMLGLTGTPDQVAEAAAAWKVYYRVHAPEGVQTEGSAAGMPVSTAAAGHAGMDHGAMSAAVADYPVEHSTFTYLTLPEVGFVELFPRETTAEEMARSTACFLNAA